VRQAVSASQVPARPLLAPGRARSGEDRAAFAVSAGKHPPHSTVRCTQGENMKRAIFAV